MADLHGNPGYNDLFGTNGQGRVQWSHVIDACEASDAVISHDCDREKNKMVIEWCDGSEEEFFSPDAAMNAISAMQAN